MRNDSTGDDGRSTRLPHDPEAEAALLGAMLLSSSAVETGLAALDSTDFYVPAHAQIFDAIRRLDQIGEDVDPITVAAELRTVGILDQIGGPRALIDLEEKCSATSAAGSYAAVVERTARQRRMIGLGLEVVERARTGVDWHDTLGRVLELGSTNGVVHSPSTIELVDLGPIVSGDLEAERPLWLRRDDDDGLFYPGRVHDLHAPPSVGKTWVAFLAATEVLEAGGNVLVLDYEDTAQNTVSRFRALGADDELLSDPTRFRYANPTGALGLAERAHLGKILSELEPDLVILDGVAGALARDGFDENSNTDVNRWADVTVKPLTGTGAAVVLLDHVTKQTADRARGARGAGAKLALIDGASYELKISRAYSRTRPGAGRLVIAKDRIGFVGGIGETAAELTFTPHNNGARFEIVVSKPDPTGAPKKLTGLMETISRRLEAAPGPLTATTALSGFGTEHRFLERALSDLVTDGYVEEITRHGSTTTYRTTKPYREKEQSNGAAGTRRAGRSADDPAGGDDDGSRALFDPMDEDF